MKNTYKDPLRPKIANRWWEIRKTRRGARTRMILPWLKQAALAFVVTLAIFGWMPCWKEIRELLIWK